MPLGKKYSVSLLCVMSSVSCELNGQILLSKDSLRMVQRSDTLKQEIAERRGELLNISDSVKNTIQSPVTIAQQKSSALKSKLQSRIDSLKAKGQPSAKFQRKLDSLNAIAGAPHPQYQNVLAYEQALKDKMNEKIPGHEKASDIHKGVKEKIADVNQLSGDLGIGPLGEDYRSQIIGKIPEGNAAPGLPDGSNLNTPSVNMPGTPEFNTQMPSGQNPRVEKGVPKLGEGIQVPDEVKELQEQVSEIGGHAKEAGSILKEGESYAQEVKTIQEEGLRRSEKLDDIAEQHVQKIDGVAALQEQQAQVDQYKELIEQYKREKAIEEELKEKSKELATDVFAQNQAKVDASMNKVKKLKSKFPVPDMPGLHKRAPNPMKGLSWRERVVPGFSFQTLPDNQLWLQFDPQVSYKLSGTLSAGAGYMYRFSMDPGKITFRDLGELKGGKIFAEWHFFKGFHVRAEGQRLAWTPWYPQNLDPNRVDVVQVAAAGLMKRYNIGKKVKGNMQTLYHFHWGDSDPYKPKIMIRIGFDFSIKKREVKPWEKKLKEMREGAKKS